ncbi:MAG: methylmalonyl Co-A mutase-associated GTPase MeaB [Methyloligellaceae bacterium]
MNATNKSREILRLEDYVEGVRSGNRAMLARAITLVESSNPKHQQLAQEVLKALLPETGQASRVGITGVPGVGKSTLIDQLGTNLTGAGHKVAVLAVDPTSSRSGGSILGDKTRMARLASDPNAYIRPSPTSGTLGGVARKTRETMTLVEAAGFDVILVETVGVGQSETAVSEMVDFFLVLMLPGAGDELQGIKKGIIEIADMIAVNKADGDNLERAIKAASEYRSALHILTPASASWSPPVITVSAIENSGLDVLWEKICEHREKLTATGELQAKRQEQAVKWMHDMLEERLKAQLRSDKRVAARLKALEEEVRAGRTTPALAVSEIAAMLHLA